MQMEYGEGTRRLFAPQLQMGFPKIIFKCLGGVLVGLSIVEPIPKSFGSIKRICGKFIKIWRNKFTWVDTSLSVLSNDVSFVKIGDRWRKLWLWNKDHLWDRLFAAAIIFFLNFFNETSFIAHRFWRMTYHLKAQITNNESTHVNFFRHNAFATDSLWIRDN